MMVLALSFPVLLFPVPLSLLPVFPVLPSLAPVFPVLMFPALSFPGLPGVSLAPAFPALLSLLLPVQAAAFLIRPLPLRSDSSDSGLLSPDHRSRCQNPNSFRCHHFPSWKDPMR